VEFEVLAKFADEIVLCNDVWLVVDGEVSFDKVDELLEALIVESVAVLDVEIFCELTDTVWLLIGNGDIDSDGIGKLL
jgi:hypothetical protein